MYEYIAGRIDEISPTYLTVETGGIGYRLHISLNTYTAIHSKSEGKLYVHQVVREDSNEMYGFFDKSERTIFVLLISVSGVGATTAQVMLSAMGIRDIKKAIAEGDVALLQSIKGIGAKTAQRIIIDLKDKVQKIEGEVYESNPNEEIPVQSELKGQAVSALIMLGFKKNLVEKVVAKVLRTNTSEVSVEEVIKLSLKEL